MSAVRYYWRRALIRIVRYSLVWGRATDLWKRFSPDEEDALRLRGWLTSSSPVPLSEVKVLGDVLEQVSYGVGQLGMSGGEVGPRSGLASPGLGHCLAEEFVIDLPQ
jgi:hypothetical protein